MRRLQITRPNLAYKTALKDPINRCSPIPLDHNLVDHETVERPLTCPPESGGAFGRLNIRFGYEGKETIITTNDAMRSPNRKADELLAILKSINPGWRRIPEAGGLVLMLPGSIEHRN